MNTTGSPEGAGRSDQPGDDQPGGYGYSGGYGYGPGYGDPDGGGSYSYGPGYGDAGAGYGDAAAGYGDAAAGYLPAPGGPADRGAGFPPANHPGQPGHPDHPGYPGQPAAPEPQAAPEPEPPVVAATPALKGYPGGPGLGVATVDHGPAAVDGHGAHGLGTQSVWQNSQRAWRDSGVEWQRTVADWEPAEADWDRSQSAPARRRLTAPRPAQAPPARPRTPKAPKAPKTPKIATPPSPPRASQPPASQPAAPQPPASQPPPPRPAAPQSPLPQAAQPPSLITEAPVRPAARFGAARGGGAQGGGPFQVRRGVWQSAVLVVIVVAIVIVALLAFGGNSKSGTTAIQYPAAALASQDFAVPAGQPGRGTFQTVNAVAASGGTLVAAAAEQGQWLPRAEFLTSADGGHTWTLAPLRTAHGGVPPATAMPTMLAAGPDGWLALGPGAAWTSRTGSTWTLASDTGVTPLTSGDRLLGLAATTSGFLAVGENVPPGKHASSTPVAWTSSNGTSWQRLDASQLALPVRGGHALRINRVASSGGNLVIEGYSTTTRRVKHGKRTSTVTTTGPAVWYSGNGGTSWTAANVPVASRSSGSIAGLAATSSGFVVIRPGTSKRDGPDAVAYTSSTGASWAKAGTIFTTKKNNLSVIEVGGSDEGVAVLGKITGGRLAGYESSTGGSWHSVTSLGSAAQSLAGITVAAGGAVVGGGAATRTTGGQAPYLVVAGSQTSVISFSAIPGATGTSQAINDLAATPATQVAVGSANGYPAVWTGHAGRWSPVSSPALTPAGLSTLTGVAHGHQGWVAVGGSTPPSVRPLVITSADGTAWQSAGSQSAFSGPGITASQVAAGPGGYVIVGRQDLPASTTTTTTGKGKHRKTVRHHVPAHTIAAAWFSSGLAAWARSTDAGTGDLDGAGTRQLTAVTAGGPGYVAAGGIGNSPAIWTSADGQHWTAAGLPLPVGAASALLQDVAAQGSKIVATGLAVSGIGSAPFAEYSVNDGASWQEVQLTAHGTATSVTALAAAAKGFTAVGTAGPPGAQRVVVWWSATGASWKAAEPSGTGLDSPGTQAITALAVPSPSSAALTGAGYLASPTAQQPTLWHGTAG